MDARELICFEEDFKLLKVWRNKQDLDIAYILNALLGWYRLWKHAIVTTDHVSSESDMTFRCKTLIEMCEITLFSHRHPCKTNEISIEAINELIA